ncbi:OTU-like cysteine protease [Diplonema papillatum]|nr:OTU-like cysteine protease [Diplonema papillatum]
MEEAELEAACVALERVTPGSAVKLVGGMDRVRLWIWRQVACPHRLLRTTRRAQQLLGEARRKTRVEMPRTEGDVDGKGDCQFRAVSYAIHGTAGHHVQLRRLAVESLAARDITGRVEGCAKQYLARMARLGTWGDHLTLQPLAWEVGRRVVVFELAPDDTMRATVLWPGETGKAGGLVLDELDVKLSYTTGLCVGGRR